MNKKFREFFRYSKARVIVLIYTYIANVIAVDYFNIKYWLWALIFIPISMVISYYITRTAFREDKK